MESQNPKYRNNPDSFPPHIQRSKELCHLDELGFTDAN